MSSATTGRNSVTSPADLFLQGAAETLADRRHAIDAVSVVVPLPRLDGAARPLLYAAERVASVYGLEVSVRLRGGQADVQFRRLDAENR